MTNYLQLHSRKYIALLALSVLNVWFYFHAFAFKRASDINWLDIVGEGGVVVCLMTWITLFLSARPKGLVTNSIYMGLALFYFASLQDFLDEFFLINQFKMGIKFLESLPAVAGLFLLTWGFYCFKCEQDSFNTGLRKKEKQLRQHTELDTVTGLYSASYFENNLQQLVQEQEKTKHLQHAVALIDIVNFKQLNRELNRLAASKLLFNIAHIIEMSLPDDALLCRYSGERFILLLSATSKAEAVALLNDVERNLRAVCFKQADKRMTVEVQSQINYLADTAKLGPREQSKQFLRKLNKQFSQQLNAKVCDSVRAREAGDALL